ncbi:hypothetical protein BSKO_13648 [Bryopsis sp. KO-2023]|nr:hypothetical protein BSKO_13648 [Bryopsis sp. KO-2023]
MAPKCKPRPRAMQLGAAAGVHMVNKTDRDHSEGHTSEGQGQRASLWTKAVKNKEEVQIQRERTLTDSERNEVREKYIDQAKGDIKDMLWYSVFLVLFSVTTLMGHSEQDIFFFGDHILGQLNGVEMPFKAAHVKKELTDVATVYELHLYLQGVLYPFLYTGSSYDGVSIPGVVLGQGVLLGAPRIGSVRVRPTSCEFNKQFQFKGTQIEYCSPGLDEGIADTEPYGLGDAFAYNSLGNKDATYVSTKTSGWYPPPGYTITLPRQENATCVLANVLDWDSANETNLEVTCPAAHVFRNLQTLNFVDAHTRAVFVDFAVYHPLLDRVCSVRVFFELLQSGGVITDTDIDIFRPYPYQVSTKDIVRLGGEAVVLIMVLAYMGEEARKIFKEGWSYFKDVGKYPHLINLVLFIVVIAYEIDCMLLMPSTIQIDSDEYIPIRKASDVARFSQSLNSFNMFLSWMKVFKYMSFIPQFSQLTRTLSKAASAVGGFFLIIGLVLIGSGQAFLLAFGARLNDYRNFQESIYSLIRALLMDFNLQELREANLWLGPLFFGSFIILAVFVLLNMFIAIISDAYTETREELRQARGHMSYGSFIVKAEAGNPSFAQVYPKEDDQDIQAYHTGDAGDNELLTDIGESHPDVLEISPRRFSNV